MRVIRFFVFVFVLNPIVWADFKLNISKNITTHQLENIIRKGWNEENKTLNRMIVKQAKKLGSFQRRLHFYLSAFWVKVKSSLGVEVKDFGYMSQYLAQMLVCVATPKIEAIYTEYLDHIQKNKHFIANLKKLQDANSMRSLLNLK